MIIIDEAAEGKLRELHMKAKTLAGWWEPPTAREVLNLLVELLEAIIPPPQSD